jgi:pimeloyl-ACP methyl ester carboxylesterase
MSDASQEVTDGTDVRSFTIEVAETELEALRARIAAARWPDKETVGDHSQGVPLATIRALAHYWLSGYDWRNCETKLNALPHYLTEIDGLDIHFIHVRSTYEGALPLIVTYGWPGSVIEQLKIIDPLTNPTAHGAQASDAFHLVIPSMPGYGFSAKPTTTGWDPARIARAWVTLMGRLGYTQFVAQGGDWGGLVTEVMATLSPPGLAGIHTNFPGTVPPDIEKGIQAGDAPPSTSPAMNGAPTDSSRLAPSNEATPAKWEHAPKHCSPWPIHPSGWPPGCSTMTPSARKNSHTPSWTDSPMVPSPETTSSTTSPSIA